MTVQQEEHPSAPAAATVPTSPHVPENGNKQKRFDVDDHPAHQQRDVVAVVRPGRALFVRTVSIGRGRTEGLSPAQLSHRNDSDPDPAIDSNVTAPCSSSTTVPPSSNNDSSNGSSHLPPPPEKRCSSSADTTACSSTDVTFVFVHGLCSTEQHYHLLLNELHASFSTRGVSATCVLYDMAGCGQSPPPTGEDVSHGGNNHPHSLYSYDHSKADLAAVLQRVQSSKSLGQPVVPPPRIVVVGHSYAANLILPLVQQWPQQPQRHGDRVPPDVVPTVRAMVLVSCGIRTPSLPHPDGGVALLRYGPIPLLRWMQPQLTQGFAVASLHPETPPKIVELVTHHCNANDMKVVQAYHRHTKWVSLQGSEEVEEEEAMATPTSESAVPTSASFPPALVLHGALDAIIPPAAGHELAQLLNTQMHVVPGAGHMVSLEQPRAVAAAMVDFLQREALLLR